MDSKLLLLLGLGGRMDSAVLQQMIEKMNERRRRLFTKLADLLFGLVMFFYGDLEMKVEITNATGQKELVDATDPRVKDDQKMSAIIEGMKASNKGLLFREVMRPFLIAAAEMLANLMAPDPAMLAMLSGGGAAGSTGSLPLFGGFRPALPAAQPQNVAPPAPPVNPQARRGTAENPINAPRNRGQRL